MTKEEGSRVEIDRGSFELYDRLVGRKRTLLHQRLNSFLITQGLLLVALALLLGQIHGREAIRISGMLLKGIPLLGLLLSVTCLGSFVADIMNGISEEKVWSQMGIHTHHLTTSLRNEFLGVPLLSLFIFPLFLFGVVWGTLLVYL
ncbi:hypothetical protein P3T73_05280 [Kiritimatiellota bacterium B12222]|nr:hypothetical protein P3T73_05280 [Kiritimatiellota bacterium B12222]